MQLFQVITYGTVRGLAETVFVVAANMAQVEQMIDRRYGAKPDSIVRMKEVVFLPAEDDK